MEQRTTLEIIAPSVEEAISQGLAELNLSAEAVDVEVLDAGSKGLFGLGGRQVRVRLTAKASAFEETAASFGSASEPVPAAVEPPSISPTEDSLLKFVEETISTLLHHLRLTAQVSARYGEKDRENRTIVQVDIHGDDLGVLIGRRSEVLNALQYVAGLIVGKEMQQWVQLVVDVEGYRSRRERQLRQMARRVAEQAVKTGRRQVLEPMTAAERRIVHLELRDHPAVTTESVGEEPARKVTIIPKNE
ncbi:MAG: RNA-binding cell elongation regulator Jag/EloR [Candidatus Villigracilaceae bacterium]